MNLSSSQDTVDQEPGQAPTETPVERRLGSPHATSGGEDLSIGLIESETRHPDVRPLTLADLIKCVESPSPTMRSHAVKLAYALGASDGKVKANQVLEGL